MRLLPNRDNGWAPYTWLAYSGFFYLQPVLDHAPLKEWVLIGVGTVAFLLLYFSFFWLKPPWNLVDLAGLMLLGAVFAPYNGGASTFFIYAAAFIPFAVETEIAAVGLMSVLLLVVALEWRLLHLGSWFLVYGGGLAMVVGGSNIFFAQRTRMLRKLQQANQEIEHLAKVAERERIARDLHDVLGHTLSVIILKSELAGKLVERDPERARAEIRDVEQTSRQALAEVRNTIRGYRSQGLEAEIQQARQTLGTAGIVLDTQYAAVGLSTAQETVLSMVVREAVTNVVRHAQARHCRLQMSQVNGHCLLEIEDDGRGSSGIEGNGLRGMRERIEALGGQLERTSTHGTRLNIRFPLEPKECP